MVSDHFVKDSYKQCATAKLIKCGNLAKSLNQQHQQTVKCVKYKTVFSASTYKLVSILFLGMNSDV